MTKRPSTNRNLAVVLGFAIFIAASLFGGYLLRGAQSPAQACEKRCSGMGKSGTLVYTGPASPKSQYKEANSECQCH